MLTLITLLVTVIDIKDNKISRISIYWKISEDVLKYKEAIIFTMYTSYP